MYAVIATGGKQERVEVGMRVDVERLTGDDEATVELSPVLLVDGDTVVSGAAALEGALVTGRIVGEAKGPKITGFTYKSKTRSRRRFGHRQKYTTVEITEIRAGSGAAQA